MAALVKTITGPVMPVLDSIKDQLNALCKGLQPWQIVVYTAGTTLVVVFTKQFLFQEESLKERGKKEFFRLIKKIPYVKAKIDAEMAKTTKSMVESLYKDHAGHGYVCQIPMKGYSEKELILELEKYQALAKTDWKKGRVSGTVYSGEEKLTQLMAKTYSMFAWTNPLHPDVFPDIRKMEAEVVRMCCTIFNGGPETCGTVTQGGTESIMLACLAYRNLARERGIKVPEIVAPITVHAAFDKAASYFHMTIKHIAIDPVTGKVNVKAMRRAISSRTCVIVGSGPGFPHGIIDPIQEIAALGKRYNIPVHVDCCLGGFLLPFMNKAGFELDPFDFRVDGVTSISADTHKYGYAPKGSSVIMYSEKSYRKFQFFVQPNWTGGIYASPTIAGSRSGAIIAACWATMMYIGEQGYVDATRKIITTARKISKGMKEIKGIFVFGDPQVSVVGIGSDDFNIFNLSDALAKKGWNLNPLQFPSSIHICVTLPICQDGVAEEFIADVKAITADILKNPNAKDGGMAAIYGMAQSIPDRSMVKDIACSFVEGWYNTTVPTVSNGDMNGSVH
ncbi:sphingosine-1-phosphate lyase 1 [Patella vulgata]|uniref:sphingosine-1-phosphate lyase 1 n=1 Tax=Patella vulgata TaxID=6465 RepID=UPI0021800A41|nr:sphingosine-1-phosphate lyase 1 [Patella vulgata]